MKNNILKGSLLLFLMLVSIASSTVMAQKLSSAEIEKIKQEIQEKENAFAEIYNTGEVKKIGYYADDAITYYQNMKPINGKKERQEFLAQDINANTNKISFTTNDVFVSNDGIQVVELGSYKVVDKEGLVINTGNYMSLFEKRDGKYVCLRDMSASDMVFEE